MHHDTLIFLVSLATLLAVARGLGDVCRFFGFPTVAGEIVAGVVIGKTVFGRVAPDAYHWLFPDGVARQYLAGYTTVAVMLLLVVAGLEIDLTVVRKSGPVVLITSALGIVVPFALGYGLGMILPGSDLADPEKRALHASFLGIALSISALPVIAKTLLDLGLMKTDLGLIILSAAVFDDLIGWIGFSVLSRQFTVQAAPTLGRVAVSVLLTALFVGAALLIVRPIADRALARMQDPKDTTSGRVLSMIMLLALIGGAITDALGMHPVFGAFVMGIAIGDSSRLREHTRQVLRDFVTYVFTPVFFASLALRFDFLAAFDLRLVVLLFLIACLAKVSACALGARLSGIAWNEAIAIGFGMNSRGAMEILLATIALESGIINERIYVALVIMAILTSVISGPVLSRLLKPSQSPVAKLLRGGVVLLEPPCGGRDDLITLLATQLAANVGHAADAPRFATRVVSREAVVGTGVGDGVAFPHADVEGLEHPALGFARLGQGLDFDAPDGKPVTLVFLLLVPHGEYDVSLKTLSAMARLLAREDIRRLLHAARDARAVIGALEEPEQIRPSRLSGTLRRRPPSSV